MRLTASDIVTLYRPTPCPLRVYLRHQGVEEAEPSEFEKVLQDLGKRHEKDHLASLGPYQDISAIPAEQRTRRTSEAIQSRVPMIYQGELAADTQLGVLPVTIVGQPDFLILDGNG